MHRFTHVARPLAAAATLLVAAVSPSLASTTFGTLSNFDVFNDTGEDCHGFEIELEGIHSSDVVYTFGAPYERYGNPVVTEDVGRVFVRYMSPYDADSAAFTQTTPMAPAVISPTNGHACWTGGSGSYATSGCEHFGVSLRGNATKTTYRWLVADPAHPGSLKASGTQVTIPAPVWSLQPPPPAAPDQVNPVVVAEIEAPEPQVFEFGEPMWVKVFVTESPEPADLDHLLSDDPAVPDEEVETETEWQLLQQEFGKPAQKLEGQGQLNDGNESVTRRYEFYEYVGAFDPETHEAFPMVSDSHPDPSEIGNYIGAQMAAVNLADVLPAASTTSTTTTTLPPDTDSDGVSDDVDNCLDVANADQRDLDADALGDVCDDVDASLEVRSASVRTKRGTTIATAKGQLVLAGVDDSVDASAGFGAEIAELGIPIVSHAFGPTECATSKGKSRCRSADKSAVFSMKPVAGGAAHAWSVRIKSAAAAAVLAGPLTVRVSHATSVDRAGDAAACKASMVGIACR